MAIDLRVSREKYPNRYTWKKAIKKDGNKIIYDNNLKGVFYAVDVGGYDYNKFETSNMIRQNNVNVKIETPDNITNLSIDDLIISKGKTYRVIAISRETVASSEYLSIRPITISQIEATEYGV